MSRTMEEISNATVVSEVGMQQLFEEPGRPIVSKNTGKGRESLRQIDETTFECDLS